ncbi:MAG TPA: translation initiation factor IF-2, partial [Myxococcota bacterium]|nr:translation initiation factor IF-2 [Myxococcota bacterium]
HAKDAGVPIIVAINKMDLPGANPDRITQDLTKHGLVPEAWGGDTIVVQVSAKTKEGLENLLDSILLQAEVMELRGNPEKPASGVVVEARLDRGRGPVATLLVKNGTLRKGDYLVVGMTDGRVRALYDFEGQSRDEVGPGRPVLVQGLAEVPAAGDSFNAVKNEREAKKLLVHREEEATASKGDQSARLSLEDFYEQLRGAEKLELKVLVKADVQGSAEAVRQALEKMASPKVGIKVIHAGVGAISETDVNLAKASGAVLVGFNIRPDPNAKRQADQQGLEIRTYNIIYDLTDDIRKAQTGLLPATLKENVVGRAEVRDLFTVPKVGVVAGVAVTEGKLMRSAQIRLLRDAVEVWKGKLSSLKRFKDDTREVPQGMECGCGLDGFNDIKRGDVLEAFVVEEIRPSL